jgi:hypothetical protein
VARKKPVIPDADKAKLRKAADRAFKRQLDDYMERWTAAFRKTITSRSTPKAKNTVN